MGVPGRRGRSCKGVPKEGQVWTDRISIVYFIPMPEAKKKKCTAVFEKRVAGLGIKQILAGGRINIISN